MKLYQINSLLKAILVLFAFCPNFLYAAPLNITQSGLTVSTIDMILFGVIILLSGVIVYMYTQVSAVKTKALKNLEDKRAELIESRAKIQYLEQQLDNAKIELSNLKASEQQIKNTAEKIIDFASGKLNKQKVATDTSYDLTNFKESEVQTVAKSKADTYVTWKNISASKNGEGFTKTDISKVVEGALVDINPVLEERGIKLYKSFAKVPLLKCQRKSLTIAFNNILQNALDAIEGKGKINISVYMHMGDVLVSITDNGAVHSSDFEKEISLFSEGEVTAEMIEENDLWLSKKIIEEHHGGKMEVNSEARLGAEIVTILPLN